MNKKQALDYLRSSGFSEEQIETIVKALQSMNPQSKVGEWISVEDKMPEKGEKVLCTLDDEFYDEGEIKILYLTNSYSGEMMWVDGYIGTENYDVCAWMPLPKPYKSESEVEE